MTEKIIYLLKNENVRKTIGKKVFGVSHEFTMASYIKAQEEMYTKALAISQKKRLT